MKNWKEKARERVKEKKAGATFGLTVGPNTFRILPNKNGPEEAPFVEFRVHRDVGPDKRFCGCGKDINGAGKCWLCDVKVPELLKSELKSKHAMADAIQAKEAFVVQVSRIDPETKKFSAPKPWWVSTGKGIPGRPSKRPSLAVIIQSLLASERFSYEDPKKGYNITIERTGMGRNDTVYGQPERDENPSKVPTAVLEASKPLEEFIPEYDAEVQKALYYGKPLPGEEGAEEEEEEAEAEAETEEAEESEEAEEEAEAEAETEEAEEEGEEEAEEEGEEEAEEEEEEEFVEPEDEPEEEEEFEPEDEPEPAPPPKKKTTPAPVPAKKKAAAPPLPPAKTAKKPAPKPTPATAKKPVKPASKKK